MPGVAEFGVHKNTKDGLQTQCKKCKSIYHSRNKEEISKKRKQAYLLNRDAIVKKQKEYSSSHKIEKSEYDKLYREKNKEKVAKTKKLYAKTPIGRANIKNTKNNRRTKLRNGDVTALQLVELQKSATVCYWCEESLKDKKIHIDHYYPIALGGEHTLGNLVVSCSKCNRSKQARMPEEFANSIGRLL